MKKTLAVSLFFLFGLTTLAFGHAGELHTYMGTISMLHDDSFMMKESDGKEVSVLTSETTIYLHADNHAGKRSELKAGQKVVVKMSKDGKTALSVKMAIEKTSEKK